MIKNTLYNQKLIPEKFENLKMDSDEKNQSNTYVYLKRTCRW